MDNTTQDRADMLDTARLYVQNARPGSIPAGIVTFLLDYITDMSVENAKMTIQNDEYAKELERAYSVLKDHEKENKRLAHAQSTTVLDHPADDDPSNDYRN